MTSAPATVLRAAVVALLASVVALAAAPASAHVSVSDVEPADGTAGPAPSVLRVAFTDDLLEIGAVLSLRDADGNPVDLGELRLDGQRTITASVPELAPGDYTWAYRAVAGDGHPLEGSAGFTVVGPEPSPSPSPSPAPSAVATAAASPSPAASPATTESPDADGGENGGALPWWWLLGVAALVAVMVAATVQARRAAQ